MLGLAKTWLHANASHESDECLTYPFHRARNGYGIIWVGKGRTGAHRYMCRIAHGDPENDKLEAAHSCGNGRLGCVNPRHLRWKTRSENLKEAVLHGAVFNPYGLPGTRRDEEKAEGLHPRAKVAVQQVSEIRQKKSDGARVKDLAEFYGVHYSTISKIASGSNWSSL